MEVWYFYTGIALIYIIFTLSLNLLLGYAGQVSAAHAAFGAVGGFLTGYLLQAATGTSCSRWPSAPPSRSVIGALVAIPALNLSVEFLILLTLAMSSVIIGFFTTFDQLGGINGLTSLPKPDLFGWTWQNPSDWMLPLVIAVVSCSRSAGGSASHRTGGSSRGCARTTRPPAPGQERVPVQGRRVRGDVGDGRLRRRAAVGVLQLSTPGLFGFAISLSIFAMVIFGGMANLVGSVIGAGILSFLDPLLSRAIGIAPTKPASLG